MKERPILFSAPMVRALLAGTKTQTRRVVKKLPLNLNRETNSIEVDDANIENGRFVKMIPCPYGQPGDRLWVRETFGHFERNENFAPGCDVFYRADGESLAVEPWRPSIHMPRWASRITLEVTGVRVERLQDISEADARAEGIFPHVRGGWHWLKHDSSNLDDWNQFGYKTAALAFRALWVSINGPDNWAENPWVWVVEFKRLP